MESSDKVVEKIRAILRKADEERNPSEAERDVAIKAANHLLLKHGLSMQDVGDLEDKDERSFEHDSVFDSEGQESWRGSLLHRIARVYFCKVYYISLGSKRRRWMIVGRAEHVAATRAMHDFVAPQIEYEFTSLASRMTLYHRFARRWALHACAMRGELVGELTTDGEIAAHGRELYEEISEREGRDAAVEAVRLVVGANSTQYAKNAQRFIRKCEIAPSDTDHLGVYRRSFYEGAVAKVANRLRELMKEEEVALGDPGTALVKSELQDLERAMDEMDLRLGRPSASQRQHDAAGANAGNAAGARADLTGHRKLGGSRKQLNS